MPGWLIALIISIVVIVTIIVIAAIVVAIVIPLTLPKGDGFPEEDPTCPLCPGFETAYFIGFGANRVDVDTLDNLKTNLGENVELGNFSEPIFYVCDTAFSNSALIYKQISKTNCGSETDYVFVSIVGESSGMLMSPSPLKKFAKSKIQNKPQQKTNYHIVSPKKSRSKKSIVSANKRDMFETTPQTPQLLQGNIFQVDLPAECETIPIGYISTGQGISSDAPQQCCRLLPQIFQTVGSVEDLAQGQILQFPQNQGSLNFVFANGSYQTYPSELFVAPFADPLCFNESSFPILAPPE